MSLDANAVSMTSWLVERRCSASRCAGGKDSRNCRTSSGNAAATLAGELTAQVVNTRGRVLKVLPWQTATLFPGDVVRIGGVARGVACVGISGGFQVPLQLGSRSTYPRARIGGIEGRALAGGDRSLLPLDQ